MVHIVNLIRFKNGVYILVEVSIRIRLVLNAVSATWAILRRPISPYKGFNFNLIHRVVTIDLYCVLKG